VILGIEVSSDVISVLGRHPNNVGTKLTCGGVGKAVRVTAEFSKEEFCILSGFADWMIPSLSIGGAGCIAGFTNLCPWVS
jgi:4-hydroxy-2-oxoglutarate aldolase